MSQNHLPTNEEITLDALSGSFKIYQYRRGHRFSTDDLLVAWFAASRMRHATQCLDLGSGIGTVPLILAWCLPKLHILGVEAQSASVLLARYSIEKNQLESRIEVREADFRNGEAAGLGDRKFDLITSSPPYFPTTHGVLPEHPQKLACRFEVRGNIADYCATAARHLETGGRFFTVFPVQPQFQRDRLEQGAARAGLMVTREKPVVLKEGSPPLLGLFEMMRREDVDGISAQDRVEEPVVVRTHLGEVSSDYQRIKAQIGFSV